MVREVMEVSSTWTAGEQTSVSIREHSLKAYLHFEEGIVPPELLLASLASCMCLAMGYLSKKMKRELPPTTITVRGTLRKFSIVKIEMDVTCDLPRDSLERMVEEAKKVCYCFKSLSEGRDITTSIVKKTSSPRDR